MFNYLRIGDFSKKIGVTSEFLKFYDKENLVKPIWKDDMHYRYYADFQTVHLNEYYRLSRIGLSLNDAKNLIQTGSLDSFITTYNNQLQHIEKEIEELKSDYQYASDFKQDLIKIKNKSSWTIEYLNGFTFTSFDFNNDDLPMSEHKHEIKKSLVSQMVKFTTKITEDSFSYTLDDTPFKRYWGYIDYNATNNNTLFKKSNEYTAKGVTYTRINPGRFFCLCHSIPAVYDKEGKLADCVWDFSEPLNIMKKYNLMPANNLFQERLCVIHERDGDYLLTKTYIPIE